ncbi:PAS domain-containing sensor histidine kinase [Aliiroseovarius subalbicans]|uniref:sensor histidine kinase NtrY-like n=1 Tax=Aliiroseovarius subalbicans TaxID=2925840 RepID=UPI001F5A59EC|nr:PAS domain-containing sensor histidine kinase [uncultured Aliiroseovarius sp.]MCI2398278.1 PAS domain-containing sensor histidine kinase [Aliiroseovarius subalbicans]
MARGATRKSTWERLIRLRRLRKAQTWASFGLVTLGPILALVTFLIFGPLDQGAQSTALRLILLADIVYVLVVATMVLSGVARMIAARRRKSAGSRLHLRLTGVFALLALIPTVLVAVFAVLTVNVGLEGWFSERVSGVVGNSLAAAQAYEKEHRDGLQQDAQALANFLNLSRQGSRILPDNALRPLLAQGQTRIQRGLREAYIVNSDGDIRVRGDRSYLFDFEPPSAADLARALEGEVVIIEDWDLNEFRALVHLEAFSDHLLYISRDVDGEILNLLDETQETVEFYNQLESQRGTLLFEFGLIYVGFAVILIIGAIWVGMWFAERLSTPVGRLAAAAQRVGAGDLDARVIEDDGDDEITDLGRLFNQMTSQLKGQRDRLLDNTQQIERRRRLFDSVLGSVTAGVMGLDNEGRVTFLNRAAMRLLDVEEAAVLDHDLALLVPEFAPVLDVLATGKRETTQQELRLTRQGKQESLLVRMATRRRDDGNLEGYVVAFDDVTDLVSAQRMAAWGDVARRIAHEIKNPLTPIQLSAERIKRKFRKVEGIDTEALDQYTDVIVRQTGDLRRIVDEFSKFARMPEPERREVDLVKLVTDAVVLQRAGQEGVTIVDDLPDGPLLAELDATMIGQALTNLIKNAGEATESLEKIGAPDGYAPEVRITMEVQMDEACITISDNGIGLPEDRARLFEPYVTTRAEGTGLGLPIVKKIIEEHGGSLALTDAPEFAPDAHRGAMAEIRLPLED